MIIIMSVSCRDEIMMILYNSPFKKINFAIVLVASVLGSGPTSTQQTCLDDDCEEISLL